MTESFDAARRNVLKLGALSAASLSLFRANRAFADQKTVATPLDELGYAQVQLSSGPLDRQARENHRLVLGLDEDALLRPFRLRSGMQAPGQELGGWYDTWGFAPGATFGQWMSALARHYAITGDRPTREKLDRLVRGYAATIDAQGSFYRNNRFPSYTYDKLAGGLIDAVRFADNDVARDTLQRATAAAVPYLPPHAMPRNEAAKPGEDFSQHAWDESYTLPENQFLAYRLTGDEQHRRLGQRFLYDDFFGPLARGENVLPGKHAYSHVNALSSAAQGYLTLKQPMYLEAARQGFAMIDAQSFATGGWGPDEHFVKPGSGGLGVSLAVQHKSFETPCGSYAHFKLTRYLLRITRDSRYGDSMERVLYNTVLGAKPIEADGHAFYYSDYARQAQKTFHPDRWPCCSGTLPVIAADYRISAFFTDAQGIYVNLYVPSRVSWRQGGNDRRLTIETNYPNASAIGMRVETATPQTFAIHLRIPSWAHGATLRINGKPARDALEPGTFATIRRQWTSGDRLELELPLSLRLQSVDAEHPDTVALLAGPLVLMRMLDSASSQSVFERRSLLSSVASSGGDHWRVDAGGDRAQLRPFFAIGNEIYSTYQSVHPI
ncbi:beta-L-arabinofuranosidase domain-containing protein [Rhodanobacter sp. L36]|uniref:beta-L-arabinofuranosidase domain-containing protein n=1 Tax=Rhodanobacter sp. L36 TaxID=1747221 RepID=UPI00131D23AE|nr:beta-L-arabinofuranosidase domain-containing protein [Rhodanobacter sp. L36]